MTHISVIVKMAQYVPKTDGAFKESRGTRGFTLQAAPISISYFFLEEKSVNKLPK